MIGLSEAKKLLTRQAVNGIVTGGEQCTITWEQARSIKELLGPEIEHCWHDTSDEALEALIDGSGLAPDDPGEKDVDSLVSAFWAIDNGLLDTEEVAEVASKHSISVDDLMQLKSAMPEYIRRKKEGWK